MTAKKAEPVCCPQCCLGSPCCNWQCRSQNLDKTPAPRPMVSVDDERVQEITGLLHEQEAAKVAGRRKAKPNA